MFEHPAFQDNLRRLRDRGVHVVEPDTGPLASGLVGRGRLAELPAIMTVVERVLAPQQDLTGQVVLVTAGPTREPLDPVRFLSNRSSGRMGYAMAEAAADRGARVILVSGPTGLRTPSSVDVIHVETADDMYRAVLAKLPLAHVVIKAAAVADYRPQQRADRKIKKDHAVSQIVLERTQDILAEVGKRKGNRILVGFAAETDDLVTNAREKLQRKNVDLMVANDVTQPGAGFDVETNVVQVLDATGGVETLPLLSKRDVADRILDRVATLLHKSAS
jgi:phosphopantothenoylcysteine decarboxylase/phosphopantothenate--cysteine ligase